MNILESIYDEKLVDALFYGNCYEYIKNLEGLSEKIFSSKIVEMILNKIDVECNNDYAFGSEDRKDSLLRLLNDIRFKYPFKDNLEKSKIIDLINKEIIMINKIPIALSRIEDDNLSSETNKPTIIDRNLEEMNLAFPFHFIYFYLTDINNYQNEGLPIFVKNVDLYLLSLYRFLIDFPDLLTDEEFLKRTKVSLQVSLEFFDTSYIYKHHKNEKQVIKQLKKMNSFFE